MKHFSNEILKNYEAPAIEILEVEVEKGFNGDDYLPGQDGSNGGNSGTQPSSGGPWSGGPWD